MRAKFVAAVVCCLALMLGAARADIVTADFTYLFSLSGLGPVGDVKFTLNADGTIAADLTTYSDVITAFGFDSPAVLPQSDFSTIPTSVTNLTDFFGTRETDGTIAAGSFLPVKGRVACTLLELAQDFGQDVGFGRTVIRQKIGQSDLAAMAGIARENVSRILNDWKRRKLISRLSGYYCLEDKTKLQSEAQL